MQAGRGEEEDAGGVLALLGTKRRGVRKFVSHPSSCVVRFLLSAPLFFERWFCSERGEGRNGGGGFHQF